MNARPRWQANAGTEQRQRIPATLADTHVGVDERGLPDFVDAGAAFARRLRFVEESGRADGRWDRWFDMDEAFVLARIAAVDPERLRAEFLRAVDAASVEGLVLRVVAAARRIDGWYRALEPMDSPPAMNVCAQIRRYVERRLGGELAWAVAQVPANADAAGALQAMSPLWTRATNAPARRMNGGALGGARAVFFAFLDATARVRARAIEALEVSLQGDRHEPSSALFLAFVKLYGVVQARLNGFTARHTDFYYRDCLRMAPRAAEPDSVHLACLRVPGATGDVVIAPGTPFQLGRDGGGRDVVYLADDRLVLTDAAVTALCTLRLERDPLISPERDLGYVTRAKSRVIEVQPPATPPAVPPHWPLFGGSATRAGEGDAADAELGLAIASPLLLLGEGSREIRIGLVFEHAADRDTGAADAIAAFAKTAPGTPDGALRDVLGKVFERLARIDGDDPVAARACAEAAAPRLAVKALLRRLAALRPEEIERVRAQAGDGLTLESWVPLPGRARAAVRRKLRALLGRGTVLRFAGTAPGDDDIVLRAGGRDVLPGGAAAQRGALPASVLYGEYLLECLLHTTAEAPFFRRFGRLFGRWMLVDPHLLGDEEIRAIKHALRRIPRRRVPPRDPRQRHRDAAASPERTDVMSCLRGPRRPVRDFLFNKLFFDFMDARLTGREGWFRPGDGYLLGPEEGAGAAGRRAVTLVYRLRPEDPAVVPYADAVHGGGWHTTEPVLRLRISQGLTLFPYSALEPVLVGQVGIDVAVTGGRDAVLHNQFGRLDPSKPFNPFGPMPARGAYLVFGSPELARKRVTDLDLRIEWAQLPDDDNGFASHYRGYDTTYDNRAFRAGLAILRDGRWEPHGDAGTEVPLFRAAAADGRLDSEVTLAVPPTDLSNHYRPLRPAEAAEEFRFDLSARAGFFKVTLTQPADPFGHREYPALLTRVLSANARRRRPLPLPKAPYVPLVERLTFDYRASAVLDLAHEIPDERASADAQVLLLHPFGHEEVYPAIRGAACGVIPRYDADGNLFIGLEATQLAGPLTLLFHLRDESARRVADRSPQPAVAWSYLASNRWRPLAPNRVLADTTSGFLTSGIVTLELPDDIDRDSTVMPAGRYWLRVAASGALESFAGLFSVHAQALRATRDPAAGADALFRPRAGTPAAARTSVIGLASAVQAGAAFGGRPPEDEAQFRARAGERLRHKNRASVSWDYERLVLEHFPEVFKVKCFSGLAAGSVAPAPGGVLLVVIPHPEPGPAAATRAPRLNAAVLERIRDFVAAHASPFAAVLVRNATYERIQVRCAVRFQPRMQGGQCLQRLNAEIVGRLSPWREDGAGARFDWLLRKEEVEAWIRACDYVESVSRVSLLQVAEADEGDFSLGDSARGPDTMTATGVWTGRPTVRPPGTIGPRFPWSIALPARQHAIELMTDATPAEAEGTGIRGLEIGQTFVVGGGVRDGQP